jgi:hypothetical protein
MFGEKTADISHRKAPPNRVAEIVWFDMFVVVNLFLYFFLKAPGFLPLRDDHTWQTSYFGCVLFILAIVFLDYYKPWGKKHKRLSLIIQWVLFFIFAFATFKLSTIETTSRYGLFWLGRKLSNADVVCACSFRWTPVFSLLFLCGDYLLIRLPSKHLENWGMGFIPSTAVALLIWQIFAKFSTSMSLRPWRSGFR